MNQAAFGPRTLVVIGSGVAGLCAALEAMRLGARVRLLTKLDLGDGNSTCAQGGLSAVTAQGLAVGDSVASHITDTLRAGAWHGGELAVQELCGSAADLVDTLEEYAVQFDRDLSGNYQLGLEAAHSAHRILHAGGDATGAGLVAALRQAVRSARQAGHLEILENALVTDLQFSASGPCIVRYLHHEQSQELAADAVLLATGGLGSLYEASTNPHGATADGIGLAARAGAVISDMEFIQFHPTLVDPQLYPEAGMISEAVRGEGAVLINELGQRFMADIDQRAELAPRDVVARAIHAQYQAGHQVLIDARAVETRHGEGFLARRFPSITARLEASGLDMALAPIPVVAAQHYAMGGIHTDTHGRTSVPGLYAAGECANTTVHGANRLASNSLLEAMVFARKAVHAMATDAPGQACALDDLAVNQLPAPETRAPLELPQLKALANKHLGVYRTGSGLEELVAVLDASTPVAQGERELAELDNLYTCARMIAYAARQRTQSLGAHHRVDANGEGAAENNVRYGWRLEAAQPMNQQFENKEVNA
ncbi:FAD-dependent oxidoreductase [Glutamicibacter sp. JL.03c]|uniref:L-aspartate oxidase n=1 Tax=Glutamicibacter sp. JL.03c TaxID=2984842 RepID=UPI0021F6CAF3|nr:FAD-binding protein [Glutamicibacter sp. JL.03c]UYQ78766.1 FAD-dependent oxidoreductase [Glutamicibacter sp. JL.03c]